MAESTNEPPKGPLVDPERALGGADAVEKTTYVVGAGTDPNTRTPIGHPPDVGRTRSNPVVWGVLLLALLIGLVYVFGIAVQ